MVVRFAVFLLGVALFLFLPRLFGQAAPNDSEPVRVNVTVNPDGSRTSYQFDQAHRQATAITTSAQGKVTGKIKYQIDDAGRFSSGMVYGPDDKFQFKTAYKYTPEGRIDQEIRLNKADAVINKLVYGYDANGRPTGYTIYDASGNVIGRTTPVQQTPAPKEKKGKKR